uniref:MACPF domain-containing protein n=1 Tax=Araucaria cunninghamii TaxID=56994 RepID=A0A0D6QVJ2_ARACU
MAENAAALNTALNSVQALGRGFDVTSDIRLLYCKGAAGARLVVIDEEDTRDLRLSENLIVPDVPAGVASSPGEFSRHHTGVFDFHRMAEHFNRMVGLSGRTPLGGFNAMFNFSGSWESNAAVTKSLEMDGVFLSLYTVQLKDLPFLLSPEVKRAVPNMWEPASLASFIENFGTHIITSVTIGGRDVIYVKQHHSSPLSSQDIEKYVKDIADRRFSETESSSGFNASALKDKDVTVIFRRRGGDELVQSHKEWLGTVWLAPDVINMTFVPVTSMLDGVPGKDHLKRAIDLYLEYKPPIEDLQYFLEFQVPRAWAPLSSDLPGQERKEPVCPVLQFSLMGPKLHVSTVQVSVGRKPVTGLRLCLEGRKQNRIAIHLQHLVSLPRILQPHWDVHVAIGPPKWQGPEEQDSRWFEPVQWKNFSHVSTAPVENSETWIGDLSGVYIVTGAQLGVWDFGQKSVLYLRLLFSKVPGCTIRRSVWDHSPTSPPKVDTSSSNQAAVKTSGNSSSGSAVLTGKLAKFVDVTEMTKGPQDMPGHWLVTGAKLGVEKGRILLRVKYSLLNY